MNLLELSLWLGLLCLGLYWYLMRPYDFWRSRGVKGPKPLPFFGNTKELVLRRLSLSDVIQREYARFGHLPFFGLFHQVRPVLVVKDPELIKDILVRDFAAFGDRSYTICDKIDPLAQNLFFLNLPRWRPLRQKLSPAFTVSKIKGMFYLLIQCAEQMQNSLDKLVAIDPVIECGDLAARYTTDVIGVYAFGLNMSAITEKNSEFRRVGCELFNRSTAKFIRSRIREMTPRLFALLSPLFYKHNVNAFFVNLISKTIQFRKENNVKRNDFVDLLIDIRDNPNKINDIEMTDTLITAQAFAFFVAGFETSSNAISHTLYELALNQPIQDKVRKEIHDLLKANNGKLMYEDIKNLKYLHKVICEILRKYPPLVVLARNSTESYTFSGSNVTIPKGTAIWVPVYSIHWDPKIYPNPEVFDPDRFDSENARHRNPSFYLPFGDGPRNCIGTYFANYQSKVGIIKIIQNYRVDVCKETCVPYVKNPSTLTLTPVGGIKLKFTKINDNNATT